MYPHHIVFVWEKWWRWIFGVGFLTKNSVSYSKFVSVRTRGDQPNVGRGWGVKNH